MSTVHGGPGNIVTSGLVLNLDAANPRSYPPPYNGTTWIDLSRNGNNGVLTNGPVFNSTNGGVFVFDNVNKSKIISWVKVVCMDPKFCYHVKYRMLLKMLYLL